MADYIFSKDVGVYVNMADPGDPRDWKWVTCTTSKSLDMTVGSLERNNDCTGDYTSALPTTVSWTLAVEGDANTSPGLNEISAEDLFTIATSREIREWKLESGDDSYLRYGEGFLSSYSESISTPDYVTFSATLTGNGQIYSAIPS